MASRKKDGSAIPPSKGQTCPEHSGLHNTGTGRLNNDDIKSDLMLFRTLVNKSNDAIFIADPETGLIMDVNLEACSRLGYTYEELTSLRVIDIQAAFPDDLAWKKHVQKVRIAGSRLFRGEHRRKDRGLFPVEVSIKYITEAKRDYIVAFVRDITERVRAEETLKDQQERLRNIIEHSNEVFYMHDIHHNITYVSPQCVTIFGYTPEEMMRRWTTLTTNNPMNERGFELTERAIKTGEKQENYRLEIKRKDGDIRIIEVDESPIKNDKGEVVSITGALRDITKRRIAEEKAIRANQLASIGELAAGVAHEINNPINGIINYAQILSNKYNYLPDDREIVCKIIKEGDRIATIVRSLLSFARERKEEKVPTHISDVMETALDLTNMQFKKDGIRLNVSIPRDEYVTKAQPQLLKQVFLNIIINARHALNLKYPDSDSNKKLNIHCEKVLVNDRTYMRMIFHDTGTGIPETLMNKIMNPFFSTKPFGHGTGLGLSISHGIINEHGGELSIESSEGQYTKVTVDLPVM